MTCVSGQPRTMDAIGPDRDSPDRIAGLPTLRSGGTIPGLPGVPAFVAQAPQPSDIPVLIAVPHAGRAYPPRLVERLRNPEFAALRLEDRYVDRVAHAVAAATGASLIVAQAPRAMIDLNRATDDVDWDMIVRAGGKPDAEKADDPAAFGRARSRSGLGLIPRRLPGMGELWKRRHERSELESLIAQVHQPYHAALSEMLKGLHARWGAALMLDLHSMPPLTLRGGLAPEFVIGDRFGASCCGTIVAEMFAWMGQNRRIAAHNRPYAGGHGLDLHAAPRRNIHAVQLEIDRSSYLDARLAEPGEGFSAMVDLLVGLVRHLAVQVTALKAGRERRFDWPDAAE